MASTQGIHDGTQRSTLKRKRSTIHTLRDGAFASGGSKAPGNNRSPSPTPGTITSEAVDLSVIELRLTNVRGSNTITFKTVKTEMFRHFKKASAGLCDRDDKSARKINQRLLGVAGKIEKARSFGRLKKIHELDGEELLKDTRKRVAKERDDCIDFFNNMNGGRYQEAIEAAAVDPLIEDVKRLEQSAKWCEDLATDLEGLEKDELKEIMNIRAE